jgi:type III restriction enzyme
MTALDALYGHYVKTFELRERAGIKVPPCFIVVCNNTSTSKLVYDYVSGFYRENQDGSTTLENGRLALFRNFDGVTGNPLPRPNTLLIDSEQLEAGDALDDSFRSIAADEIDRFRREIVERTGDIRAGENITDQELLREVMNTVGKAGQLGGSIRCVVSVSMLTEGWDANNVTHVLGIRAFGTQLLCEQVIGRALRRQSYDQNEEGLFNVEYADVFGVPFDFTAKPVVAPPQPPRETIQVKAVSPDRDSLEIRFPRVEGYRIELPTERLTADFNDDSILEFTPDLVGATETQTALDHGWWPRPLYYREEEDGASVAPRPPIGSGAGGSTAQFGAVMDRFRPEDFTPRRFFPGIPDHSLPGAARSVLATSSPAIALYAWLSKLSGQQWRRQSICGSHGQLDFRDILWRPDT